VNYRQARARANVLKALAHPIRVLLVEALRERDLCVCELNRVAAVDQSAISRHLAHLRKAGIVSDRREGMRVMYHLESPCILGAFDCTLEVIATDAQRRRTLVCVPRKPSPKPKGGRPA
jgi:ArsR family transcriptional regulator